MGNMNISSLAANDVVKELSALYTGMINQGVRFDMIPSVFLWGPPGVGKSDTVGQIADKIKASTGKAVKVTDIRLLLFSPVDLRGVPMADAAREFTNWLKPKLFDLDPSPDVVNFMFLDELSAAPQSVQAAAYQITLNRTVGEHKLPENTIIIAAGNRTTDKSVAFRMPNALANRLMHFELKVDFASWRRWAMSHNVNPYVLGYLTFDRSKLYASETGSDDMAFPTPRSWMFVSNILNAMEGKHPQELYHTISGCIGSGTALEFVNWCKSYKDIVPIDDIFAGKASSYPRRHDELYALVCAISAYVSGNKEKITVSGLSNCCSYAARFPKDFATTLFLNLSEIPEIKKKLFKVAEFKWWLQKNGDAFGGGL